MAAELRNKTACAKNKAARQTARRLKDMKKFSEKPHFSLLTARPNDRGNY